MDKRVILEDQKFIYIYIYIFIHGSLYHWRTTREEFRQPLIIPAHWHSLIHAFAATKLRLLQETLAIDMDFSQKEGYIDSLYIYRDITAMNHPHSLFALLLSHLPAIESKTSFFLSLLYIIILYCCSGINPLHVLSLRAFCYPRKSK